MIVTCKETREFHNHTWTLHEKEVYIILAKVNKDNKINQKSVLIQYSK